MADDSEQVGQDEIEALLRSAQGGGGEATPPPTSEPAAPDDDASVDQDEIEALLNGGAMPAAPVAQAPPAAPQAATPDTGGANPVSSNDIELLLSKAEQALESIDQAEPQTELPPGIRTFAAAPKFRGAAAKLRRHSSQHRVGNARTDARRTARYDDRVGSHAHAARRSLEAKARGRRAARQASRRPGRHLREWAPRRPWRSARAERQFLHSRRGINRRRKCCRVRR